jgi:hypothetical protein
LTITFEEAVKKYANDEITALCASEAGRRFILLRSLSRAAHLEQLVADHKLFLSTSKAKELFPAIYASSLSVEKIKATIKHIFSAERAERAAKESELIDELYKMKEFYWGGLHQNSLEKTIVDNYVKKIRNFEELNKRIDKELYESMRGYVRCSWYNHWTSIIIEDIFKEHKNVLPAVGLVKKVDFFIRDVPFDLKVTYLPEGYVKDTRKTKGLKPELTLLKQACRQRHLKIDNDLSDAELLGHLWSVIADQPDKEAKGLIEELRKFRLELTAEIESSPDILIKWLYENQGERRFDAANRLFLVLVNETNFFDSWQLKRNRALLVKKIGAYLDNVAPQPGIEVTFKWEGVPYTTRSAVIVVRHVP